MKTLIIFTFLICSQLTLAQTKSISKCDPQQALKYIEAEQKIAAEKIQSYDPKSKTVKNKIIQDGVATNIQLIAMQQATIACKDNAEQKAWAQTEVDKNIAQLKIYNDSYCKAVVLPTRSGVQNTDADLASPSVAEGCRTNTERRMVNFIFNACTQGSPDYDLTLCQCHVKDRGNSCLYEKNAAEKLIKKVEATTEDPICDAKESNKVGTVVNSDNIFDMKTVVKAILVGGVLLYLFNQYKKSNNKKNDAVTGTNPVTGGPASPPGAKGCYGTFSGTIDIPPHDERIASRNQSLANRSIAVTGNDAVDNKNAGGGDPDGGIYMLGSFTWVTDANCNITSGQAMVFGNYPYNITGTVGPNKELGNVKWDNGGRNFSGTFNNGGKFHHGGGEDYVYGYVNGSFTPKK